ncbi:hypothetical protein [Robiginitalea aurantiaca]|uniref:DUF4133 domain-containing protein n=1 Tax=Robiginitalea aurantiaca TaxID=3056915 RepID=A0ABT7WCG7_9FLAO|nr:hypothetical protein [Robiginitalea aurantiaca]MDM9630610.1 hypothetical protein [Robiginitalea aurantiaca]
MRNLFLYYIAILLPLGITIYLYVEAQIGFTVFLILIIAYLLIYRTWVDGSRLASKGIISKKDRWKMMLPGMHMKHFTELYLR